MSLLSAKPAATRSDEIDLMALAQRLWGGRRWIFGAMVLCLCLGLFLSLRAVPIYQSQALLQLEARSGSLGLPEGMLALMGSDGSGSTESDTEIEILKSRLVIGEAVQALDLQSTAEPLAFPVLGQLPKRLNLPDLGILPQYQWGNEAITLGELRVPEHWLNDPLYLTLLDEAGRYQLALPDGTTLDGQSGTTLARPDLGLSLHVVALEGPVGRGFELMRRPLNDTIEAVQRNFTVSATARNSSILRLGYRDADPARSEAILNAISQAYVAQNIDRSAAEAENSLTFVEEQLPLAQAALAQAQQALNVYQQVQNSIDVTYETRSLLERATGIETQLSALALQEEDLKKRYTANHPTYQSLLETRRGLQAQLEALRQDTSALPETQKEIFNLNRELEVAGQVYTQLLNRSQELRVLRASTVGSVRIIDKAYSAKAAVSPLLSRNLAIALVIGAVLGVAITVLRQLMMRGVRSSEEIEELGLPVFATITYAADAVDHRKIKGSLPIHAIEKPDDLVIEAMRSMRTALHFGMLDAKTNTVLLTSTAPGAGKSFTAINLAVVAAQAGQKVCLIDADLRRGYLHRYLGRGRKGPGLATYLSREHSLSEVLLPGPVDGLSVILSGRYPPNPSELLMRDAFPDLLQELHSRFDLVLVDSPPALAVTDPIILSRYVGATLIVARHLETPIGEIEAMGRAFEAAGAKITGAVLNGYRQDQGSRYAAANYGYSNYRYTYTADKTDEGSRA